MTIKVKVLTGPHTGEERVVPPDVSAHDLLGDCLVKKWLWSVDYTAATEDEAYEWGRQDLSCRIIRALRKGLPVTFLGKTYQLPATTSSEAFEEIVGVVEDAIVSSGRIVSIGYDDSRGIEVLDLGFVG